MDFRGFGAWQSHPEILNSASSLKTGRAQGLCAHRHAHTHACREGPDIELHGFEGLHVKALALDVWGRMRWYTL